MAFVFKSSETRILKRLYDVDDVRWQAREDMDCGDKVSIVFTFITTFILVFNCYNYAFKRFIMQEIENLKTGTTLSFCFCRTRERGAKLMWPPIISIPGTTTLLLKNMCWPFVAASFAKNLRYSSQYSSHSQYNKINTVFQL